MNNIKIRVWDKANKCWIKNNEWIEFTPENTQFFVKDFFKGSEDVLGG